MEWPKDAAELNGTEKRATNMDDFGPFWTP
jgi:hypothetical protein